MRRKYGKPTPAEQYVHGDPERREAFKRVLEDDERTPADLVSDWGPVGSIPTSNRILSRRGGSVSLRDGKLLARAVRVLGGALQTKDAEAAVMLEGLKTLARALEKVSLDNNRASQASAEKLKAEVDASARRRVAETMMYGLIGWHVKQKDSSRHHPSVFRGVVRAVVTRMRKRRFRKPTKYVVVILGREGQDGKYEEVEIPVMTFVEKFEPDRPPTRVGDRFGPSGLEPVESRSTP